MAAESHVQTEVPWGRSQGDEAEGGDRRSHTERPQDAQDGSEAVQHA